MPTTTHIMRDPAAPAIQTARQISELIKKNNAEDKRTVLGLATGSTPIPVYVELVRMHREEGLDFSRVVTFNLDEYLGLPAEHPQSYHQYMHHHFFRHINISPRNIHLLDGSLQDPKAIDVHLRQYEQAIDDAGGIDIQILGIGVEGHIGFNEAGSDLTSQTRVVTLEKSTREANARFFNDNLGEVPTQAITMGIGTILKAKTCILLASGVSKAQIIKETLNAAAPTPSIPASALLKHPNAIVMLDRDAGQYLTYKSGRRYSVFDESSSAAATVKHESVFTVPMMF